METFQKRRVRLRRGRFVERQAVQPLEKRQPPSVQLLVAGDLAEERGGVQQILLVRLGERQLQARRTAPQIDKRGFQTEIGFGIAQGDSRRRPARPPTPIDRKKCWRDSPPAPPPARSRRPPPPGPAPAPWASWGTASPGARSGRAAAAASGFGQGPAWPPSSRR